ncbi:hypothetical protein, partial [Methylobacterium radiotolerans]|uniref:hypothetical protein n=1 Tax=Methylobacterium radiotolerans TaxID=31998 RepID=UPI001AECD2E4
DRFAELNAQLDSADRNGCAPDGLIGLHASHARTAPTRCSQQPASGTTVEDREQVCGRPPPNNQTPPHHTHHP